VVGLRPWTAASAGSPRSRWFVQILISGDISATAGDLNGWIVAPEQR
jgi:hypothetical protein